MKTKIIIAASLSLLLAIATGCSDTDMLPEDNNASTTEQPMQGVVRVPITIALGGSGAEEGSGGSRVAPPGIDSSYPTIRMWMRRTTDSLRPRV